METLTHNTTDVGYITVCMCARALVHVCVWGGGDISFVLSKMCLLKFFSILFQVNIVKYVL